ncbi:Predicted ATPase [Nocardioides terrae]|uniref:Predicted ATPase n=1 Tax=Nocardioides terrae TaxID=574651 RepID=A0A1I1JKY2_9ACTN|nr:LuxR family transcriptional regulator [Nocardioides terrae]SFC49259.1 Predicted ATPase [Nocardioides terrae]
MTVTDDARLFGREDIVTRLGNALDAVGGSSLGLTGDPGVGKSALLDRIAREARTRGFTVLSARGSQAESQLPYAVLHQLVAPILARLDAMPGPQSHSLLAGFGMVEAADVNPFFTSLAVLDLLVDVSRETPVLVCLDDLQWMDRPSADALAFVARRISEERVVLLCTASAATTLLGDDRTTGWLRVAGLAEDAARALLTDRAPDLAPDLRDRVVEQAHGNPLALIELAGTAAALTGVWSTATDLPMTTRLERAFSARAQELDPVSRTILEMAVLDEGDQLDDVLAAVAVVTGTAVDQQAASPAVDLGLLTVTGSTYAVAHPLVGSALRRSMPHQRRAQAHAALAAVLGAHPDRVVWHRASSVSRRDEPIAVELEQAASEARSRGAYATAMARMERAAALSPDPLDEAARLLGAAEYGYELGRFAHVEDITARVTRMTLRPRDRSRLIRLTGVFHDGASSEPEEILHLVGLARQAAQESDVEVAMQLLFGAARRVWWRDPGEVVRREIVSAVRAVPLPSGDPQVLAVLGLAESLDLTPELITEIDRAPLDAGGRGDVAALLGIAAFCAGDFLRADSFLSLAIHHLRGEGRLALLGEALAIRSWAEINLGVFDPARSADEAMRLADETGQRVWAGTARLAATFIDAVSGHWTARHELLVHAEQTALQLPNASSSLLAGAQLVRGVGDLGADRPDQAYGELSRVFTPTDPAYQRVQQLWTIGYLCEAGVRAGSREDARRTLRAVESQVASPTATGTAITLAYARAVLADDASAEEEFRSALSGAAQAFPWHQARLQLAYGSWLRRQRRVTESRDPLRSARSTFDALGAKPWAQRADQELRATGERGWQPTANAREQLSAQEAQIAGLAAQGLSNREIGQRLFLSHRTVGSHLYRIFPKLGVTSRQQLAGLLSDPPGGLLIRQRQSSD